MAIQDRWPHITRDLWDVPAPVEVTGAAAMIDAIQVPDEQSDSAAAMARRLLAYARVEEQTLRAMQRQGDPTAVKQLAAVVQVIEKLGKFTGMTLTDREVLDSPPFREITDRVWKAIEALPNSGEVARVIHEALEGLE